MWKLLYKLELITGAIALSSFSVLIVVGVFTRYVMNFPVAWAEEASLIAFAWLLFIGGAICAHENTHVIIEIIMPERGTGQHRAMETGASLVAAMVCAIMTYVSLRYTVEAAPMMTAMLRLSTAVYNSAAPAGFALMTLHLLRHGYLAFTRTEPDHPAENGI